MRHLVKLFIASIAIALVSSCSMTPPNFVDKKVDLSDKPTHGLMLMSGTGRFVSGQPNTLMTLFLFERTDIEELDEDGDKVVYRTQHTHSGFSNVSGTDTHKGMPNLIHLPEGKYEFKRMEFHWQKPGFMNQPPIPVSWGVDIQLPFSVKAGQTTYLGRLQFNWDSDSRTLDLINFDGYDKDISFFTDPEQYDSFYGQGKLQDSVLSVLAKKKNNDFLPSSGSKSVFHKVFEEDE